MKTYCFTVDDNIRFLEILHSGACSSIFDAPYMQMLRSLNRRFGVKIQLNMFFSYTPESFSLAQCSDRFAREFCENSSWLRLSFHARHNDPEFPYDGRDAALARDYDLTMAHLARIAGTSSLARTTTLHYVTASREACRALARRGVRALIGMYYDLPGREALRYYLSYDQASRFHDRSLYADPSTGLILARNDLILNQFPLSHIVTRLQSAAAASNPDEFLQLMIHEQYFYKDYVHYQPDFEKKLETAFAWLERSGYRPCFLEERLNDSIPAL